MINHSNTSKEGEKSQFCSEFSREKILDLMTETIIFGEITRNSSNDYIYRMKHPTIVGICYRHRNKDLPFKTSTVLVATRYNGIIKSSYPVPDLTQ